MKYKHALEIARQSIKAHEGLRLKPYDDTDGKSDKGDNGGKITIGYGRNLQDVGITLGEAEMMLDADIRVSLADAEALFSNFNELSGERQAVLIEMAFNLGKTRLSKFKNTIRFVEAGDFNGAADEMLDSKWHRDFLAYALNAGLKEHHTRSWKLSHMMRRGSVWFDSPGVVQ